ncbi:MAG: hypothetical protein OXU66_12540 [Gammaproteobacteria bacterium]|nr:hypothetical protein [Gammaproteobacteria bacterium]MDD9897028.1 hypothetical protein [Gammaproteobacteria bacterium]MDD9959748.1 hypothetical protein [Gammaproteobacteria bacterium]
MSAITLFYIAIVVFSLMITGLYLSVREFVRASAEPSSLKGVISEDAASNDVLQTQENGA